MFLTGEFAYKIKKPLRLPFLNFSSLERRHHFCEEEVRLNRRLAPEIYVGVIPIGGSKAHPVLDTQPAIEYAVKMREFPSAARLDRCIATGFIDPADILEFAELIGVFHAKLPPALVDSAIGSAANVRAMVEKNLKETAEASPGRLPPEGAVHTHLLKRGHELDTVLRERKRGGAIREGHGDLHLENLIYWRGKILPFDALEFDPSLRYIDVVDETAFFAMDLIAHGRSDLAYIFLTRYLEVTGDYAGLAVLNYFMIHRALVRAKVRAIKASQSNREQLGTTVDPYLTLAEQLTEFRRPVLIITRGFSGSGKTTLTERLIPGLPALRVRSDIERKRLAGLAERQCSHSDIGGGIYSADLSEATYAKLASCAETGLRGGLNMIVDAAFLSAEQRQRFMNLAIRVDAEFLILDCRASVGTLRQRIAAREARAGDASEATVDVLAYQLTTSDELTPPERERAIRVDTEVPGATENTLAQIRAFAFTAGDRR